MFSFSEFFSNFERNIFRLSAKKLQENVKTTFCVSGGTICSLKIFLKVLHRFGFSAKNFGIGTCSQNSIYVSRVKIAEEIFFLFFLSTFFQILSEKFLRLLAKKRQEFVKTTLCVSRGTICSLKIFFKSFELFRIFCRNLWHGSQNSIYVSRVKIAEEIIIFILPFWIFSDFERKFFQIFLAKKCQKFVKTKFYVSRVTICFLNFF